MDISLLEQTGLTRGEAKVYLSLLKLGETTTGPIIKQSRISSSKVYEILGKLIQKGLASHITKDRTKYFQPASPTRIEEYVKEQQQKYSRIADDIHGILPELRRMQKSSEEQQEISLYEGWEGVKIVFSRILNSLKKGEEYLVFTNEDEATSEELRLFFLNYHAKRAEAGVKVKLLSRKKHKEKILSKYPRYALSQRRFIDMAFPTGVFILKDIVIHFIYKPKPTVYVIRSRQNADSYREFFEGLWKMSR